MLWQQRGARHGQLLVMFETALCCTSTHSVLAGSSADAVACLDWSKPTWVFCLHVKGLSCSCLLSHAAFLQAVASSVVFCLAVWRLMLNISLKPLNAGFVLCLVKKNLPPSDAAMLCTCACGFMPSHDVLLLHAHLLLHQAQRSVHPQLS